MIKNNQVIKTFSRYYKRANIKQVSPMLAYYSLLALFPAIIALGALLPYIGFDMDSTIQFLKQFLPKNINDVLIPLINGLLDNRSVSLFSVGLVVTLWSLSKLFANLKGSVEEIYGVKKVKSTWILRIISTFWIIGILLVEVLLMFLLAISKPIFEEILKILPATKQIIDIIQKAQWPLVILVLLIGGIVVNYAMMPIKKPKLKPLIFGTIIEVIAFLGLTQVFGLYVKYAAKSYSFYQAVGGIIILLIWFNLVATIVLFGTVCIATLTKLADIKDGTKTLPSENKIKKLAIKHFNLPNKDLIDKEEK